MDEAAPKVEPLVLDAEAVAALLAVRADTVKNLHRIGHLPGVLIGRHLRWRRRDVEQYVDSLQTGGAE
jgi:excisionase family DNA binding protein